MSRPGGDLFGEPGLPLPLGDAPPAPGGFSLVLEDGEAPLGFTLELGEAVPEPGRDGLCDGLFADRAGLDFCEEPPLFLVLLLLFEALDLLERLERDPPLLFDLPEPLER